MPYDERCGFTIASMQSFRRVEAWRKAHALLLNCNRVLRRFPSQYGSLRTQLRRAAESLPTNIVEGRGCATDKEFARFLQISSRSCDELEYHLLVAHDYAVLETSDWRSLTADTQEARRMIIGLRQKVLKQT